MKNALVKFNNGFSYIVKGWRTVKSNKDLVLISIIPMILNVVLFIFLFGKGIAVGSGLIQQALAFMIGEGEIIWWYKVVSFILSLVLFLGLFVVIIYLIFILGTIIASPFLGFIAESIFKKRGLLQDKPFSFTSWLGFTLRMIKVSVLKSLILLVIGLVLFILSFIPGLNLLSSYITCVIMAFDTMDYAFEVDDLNLNQRFQFLKLNFVNFSGMGLVVGLTVLVPGLTLLALPIMVAGATETYIELRGKNDTRPSPQSNM